MILDKYTLRDKVLATGLILTPFLTLASMSNWDGKLFIASMVCLAVFFSVESINFRRVSPWLIAFLGVIFIQPHFIPKYTFQIMGGEFINPWSWKCYFNILCFFLLYVTLISNKFDIKLMTRCMMWAGTAMAVYIILQTIGVEQFWARNTEHPEAWHILRGGNNPWAYGSLGNAKIAGAFLALTFPFTLAYTEEPDKFLGFLKRIIPATLHVFAVILTNSRCAALGFLVGAIIVLAYSRPRIMWSLLGLMVAGVIGYYLCGGTDSGRLVEWQKIWTVFTMPRLQFDGRQYGFFGQGMGSMPFAYSGPMQSPFTRAHNEYLEILFCGGIVGFVLFVKVIFGWVRGVIRNKGEGAEHVALFASAMVSIVMAFWVFVWQIGPLALYALVCFALSQYRPPPTRTAL